MYSRSKLVLFITTISSVFDIMINDVYQQRLRKVETHQIFIDNSKQQFLFPSQPGLKIMETLHKQSIDTVSDHFTTTLFK